jgi:hypothetical protein
MANAYGMGIENSRTAAHMIADAKGGTISKPGQKVLDQKNAEDEQALKGAIIQYTDNKLDARYFGNKLNAERDMIAGDLRLLSDYDSHNKVNRWYVEPLE